jgi:subfamily B ATP-binding cassette protein MsbA
VQDIRTILRRLVFPYAKGYLSYFILAVIGMILTAAGTAASAYLVKPVLDQIFIAKDLDALYLIPYAIILVYAMKGGGKYMQVYFSSYIGQDIIRKVRDRLLEQMLRLDIAFFHSFRSGELISRNINDVERIRTVVSTMIPEIARETLTIIGLLAVVIYQSPKLSFFALVLLPLVIVPLSMIARKLKHLSHRSQEKTSDITAKLAEIFSNVELIKAHASERFEYEKFSRENSEFFKINMKSIKTSELSGPLMETIGAIGVAIVIIVGGREVIAGEISVGSFFSFLTALFMLYTPIKRISHLYNNLQDAVAAGERILFIFDQRPHIVSTAQAPLERIEQLCFDKVSLHYGQNQALHEVSLEVTKGEKLALVGSSGGGKSSIINLILRFYDPSAGTILLDGTPLAQFDLASLRNRIAIVTQRVYIFHDTIAANVAYGRSIDREKVRECLRQAHALEFIEVSGGIDRMLDENGTDLSGGQRQRIAIARALYVDPEILIFDEATSALDTQSEQRITEAIEEISQQRITILIAHRLSTIRHADKIAVLDQGRVVCIGSERELLERCETYQRLALATS